MSSDGNSGLLVKRTSYIERCNLIQYDLDSDCYPWAAGPAAYTRVGLVKSVPNRAQRWLQQCQHTVAGRCWLLTCIQSCDDAIADSVWTVTTCKQYNVGPELSLHHCILTIVFTAVYTLMNRFSHSVCTILSKVCLHQLRLKVNQFCRLIAAMDRDRN